MNNLNTLPNDILALSLESLLDQTGVGVESISYATLRSHFTKVNAQALKILNYYKEPDIFKITSLKVKDVTLKDNVREAGYMSIRDVEVYRPSGFVGNVLDFARMLDRVSPSVLLLNDSLVQMEQVIGSLIVNPEDTTKPQVTLKKVKLDDGKELLEEFRDFFLGQAGMDEVKLGKIYPNLTSISDASELLLELTERFNGSDVRQIKDRGDVLYKTLTYLEEELSHRNLEMTAKWRRAIGKELYTITVWLGIYSLFITKLIAASVAHRDTITKLNNL